MSVIRQKRRTRFTIVDNVSVNDERLSLRAKGLHLVLLSKPDHWEFSSDRLAAECIEGRDAIRAALKELREAGYVTEIREQGGGGRWTTIMEVTEVPAEDIPVSKAGRVGVDIRPKTGFQATVDRVLGEPASGESGDEREDGAAKTESNKINPMPAARVEVGRGSRGKAPVVEDEVLGRGDRETVEDAPARRGSGPSIGGIAKDFERSARQRYPLGDNRRITNLTALRANISRWHKQDGIPLAEVDQALDVFWAGNFVKHDGEPWRRFINVFARVHTKATAPDTSDPAYYADYEKDTSMSELEKWMQEQGL